MAADLATRPTATMFDVESLVAMAWQGHIRVPHFQRQFRWQRRDVISLFDSIMRGYPVGALLLWRRHAEAQALRLGALHIQAPAGESLWVVDGQQRIISLANALHDDGSTDERFRLAYDLRREQFVTRPTSEDPLVVPLPVLFDLQRILGWFSHYPEAASYIERAHAVTKTLRQFPVPAYEVVEDDPAVLRDIFDRMNNYGKRLSRAEVFSALFAGGESGPQEILTFEQIAADIDIDFAFGTIDKDTVLKAVLARRGPDVLREIRNEFDRVPSAEQPSNGKRAIADFTDEDRDTAYQLGAEALRRSVAFLQDVAGVPHVAFLPYRHLLVVLARFFALYPDPDTRSTRLLRRWFWRAAAAGPERFKGATTGAIRTLSAAVVPADEIGSLQNLLRLVDQPSTFPDLRRFRSNAAGTKIVLCAWWHEHPRSFVDGEPFGRDALSRTLVDQSTAVDAIRSIVRRAALPEEYRFWAANRILLPDEGVSEVVGEFVHQRPVDVSEEVWKTTLRSHMLDDVMLSHLEAEDVEGFLRVRNSSLTEQVKGFLEHMCEWAFEDTPPLSALQVEDLDSESDT